MWFSAAIIASTLITLTSIFAVYKTFLEKPLPPPQSPGQQIVNASPLPSGASAAQNPSPAPAAAGQQSPVKSSVKPKSSISKTSTIGTLTVLQDNTSNATSNGTSSQTSGSAKISGTISISGTIPSSSSIVIVARENGSGNQYQTVVSGVTTTTGSTWSWNTAQSGKAYDMLAILKGSSGGVNTDYATSQTYTVTAPASSQTFTISASAPMSAPTGTITTTCTTHNSNNTWYATANFPTVSGGEVYKLQVGSTSGAADITQVTQNAQSTTNQTVSVTLTDSTLYYAQYSVAGVPSPTSYQYSAFSTTQTIKCP